MEATVAEVEVKEIANEAKETKVSAKRKFNYNGLILDDPNPKFDTQEVKNFYAGLYAEINNSSIKGPVIDSEGYSVFTFNIITASKG